MRVSRSSRLAFSLVWGGQSVSLLMSGATAISLSIWVFAESGSAVLLSTVVAVKSAVAIYVSPLAGQLADRITRKKLIVVADLMLAGCSALLIPFTVCGVQWLPAVLAIVALTGAVDSLLIVSLSASVRDIRGEVNLTRANGIISFLESSPSVVAPVLGAFLVQGVGIGIVLLLDVASYLAAALLAAGAQWSASSAPLLTGATRRPFAGAWDGVKLILSDRPFARLQFAFAGINAATGLGTAAVSAYLLSSSAGGAGTLGAYNSCAAAGLLIGSILVAAFGARLSRRAAVPAGLAVAGIVGRICLGLTNGPMFWFFSGGLRSVGLQLSNAPLTALWQEQTAREDQGKVFGARRLLGQGPYPLALLGGGFLADYALTGAGGPGVATLLISIGVFETGLASYLHFSGTIRTIAERRGTFITSHPSGYEATAST